MKTIQWYPGHMAKAMGMMRGNLALVDGVVFVLDARCPASSFNPKLKELAGSKPVLYVFNKCDLADGRADALVSALRSKGAYVVKLNATDSGSRKNISAAISKLVEKKREASLSKGQTRTFRFMIAGVPNTGKSTLINLLAGSKRAGTGDKAGVTRGKQWIRLEGFELLDTPGTMPPSFENRRYAARLAFIGSINDDILDIYEIALELLAELSAKYPARLKERYGVSEGSPEELLEGVCKKRGFVLRGGDCDVERGARAVIDDFRKGRLGGITLDGAEDIDGLDF